MSYIEIGKEEGKLIVGGEGDDRKVVSLNRPYLLMLIRKHELCKKKFLVQLLPLQKLRDFDEAIEIANNTEYGLTGAVITNNRDHIEKAREDFHVGNLYFNRGCTGAIVGYQPFGGFNMSGTDSKAGGPDYLILHMQAKTIAEQIIKLSKTG